MTDDGSARYAFRDGTWFLVLSGELRHTLGPALNALLDRALAGPDDTRFVLDLSAAESIDSTCLGILARIASWTRERGAPRAILISHNPDITETLEAVCFDRLFEMRGGVAAEPTELSELEPRTADVAQLSTLLLEAHRRLCAIDEKNERVFRDVVAALEQEIGPGG
jgi:anti-anti-sigma factor